jgi:KTSC domain
MKLTQIDLTNLVAIGHNNNRLGLLIDQAGDLEYLEIPAPRAAFEGLQQLDSVVAPEETIDMHSVQSTMANAVGYDRDRALLQIEFSNGAVYQYEDVGEEAWEELCDTHSPGQFFNQAIKGQYRSRRV